MMMMFWIVAALSLCGREFHAASLACEKAHLPNSVRVCVLLCVDTQLGEATAADL